LIGTRLAVRRIRSRRKRSGIDGEDAMSEFDSEPARRDHRDHQPRDQFGDPERQNEKLCRALEETKQQIELLMEKINDTPETREPRRPHRRAERSFATIHMIAYLVLFAGACAVGAHWQHVSHVVGYGALALTAVAHFCLLVWVTRQRKSVR
jgi:ferric-dicitrate binding protein FerR (iron transport regulator)